MAGFLSQDQITKVRNLAATLHTTFARTITVYKNAKKTLIASNDSWNSLYRRTNTGSTSSVEYTTESETFSARIYYDNMDTAYLTDDGPADQAGTQNKVVVPDGTVKIVVEQAGYDYISEARRVEFDGTKFIIESDGQPRGLTSNQFYTFVLSPVD
mgnify:FL=1|jgi:hypothetical protein|tara:strand:- start:3326 stop:3793 length:468 start_codon:yes stop_codon:yes gene_type:complete